MSCPSIPGREGGGVNDLQAPLSARAEKARPPAEASVRPKVSRRDGLIMIPYLTVRSEAGRKCPPFARRSPRHIISVVLRTDRSVWASASVSTAGPQRARGARGPLRFSAHFGSQPPPFICLIISIRLPIAQHARPMRVLTLPCLFQTFPWVEIIFMIYRTPSMLAKEFRTSVRVGSSAHKSGGSLQGVWQSRGSSLVSGDCMKQHMKMHKAQPEAPMLQLRGQTVFARGAAPFRHPLLSFRPPRGGLFLGAVQSRRSAASTCAASGRICSMIQRSPSPSKP